MLLSEDTYSFKKNATYNRCAIHNTILPFYIANIIFCTQYVLKNFYPHLVFKRLPMFFNFTL